MPWGVTAVGVTAATVAPPPIVQGEQLACVTLNVRLSELIRLATGKVPLKAESLEPVMTTLEPGAKLALLARVAVATLLVTLILAIGNGVPGVSMVGATPAVGIATPWPTRKSLTPP